MKYNNITKAVFLDRPNRFTAHVERDGRTETVHVKNTGRCRELLQPGSEVYLEKSSNPDRKTQYDLVAVKKQGRFVNLDSAAPNKAVEEWLRAGGLFKDVKSVRPESAYGGSRLDFLVKTDSQEIYIEVKGVTLEENNIAAFPDAPSERAVKHLYELMRAGREGYGACVIFVIQMEGVEAFVPNLKTHPAFAKALEEAEAAGVKVLAYDCGVTPESMTIGRPVPVRLGFGGLPEPLLKWYDGAKRTLPWREDPAPYRVWVSEIMLQQTRVEAVKPYFERFMKALPDLSSLAEAEEETLLKLWEGLGYYNRVRNMNKAAVMIQEKYGGKMPDTYEELTSLPGIGSYTAGAVASIAYGKKLPAVDGNVLRVISRLRADDSDVADAKVRRRTEERLAAVMPDRPGDFNQALMELGAMVCLPNGQPKCGECPLMLQCLARAQGNMQDYPRKTAKKPRKIEEKTMFVIWDGRKAALCKRPEKGLLAGMYEFPHAQGHLERDEAVKWLKERGIPALRLTKLEESRHIFTHKEWHMTGYSVRVDELERMEPEKEGKAFLYVELERMEREYPIPAAFAAYLNYMRKKEGASL